MPPTKAETTAADYSPPEKSKYIVPPGLHPYLYDFLNHCKVAKNEPIMIVGDTGVGKSMFLNVVRQLFEHEHGGDTKKHPVCWVNCAHFGPNLARAELFGHVRGAFTGATRNADGCVKLADNGLLILEEVGELPLEVQAMLLTFIETGQYKRLGDPTEYHANVRVVGATNREDALRHDFRYRFLPFYLPSIYERRADVLYYLYNRFPDLIPTLTMSEVLTLLAYNWPGNVREINRVGFLMQRHKFGSEQMDFVSDDRRRFYEVSRLQQLDNRYTFLDSSMTMDVLQKVNGWGGNGKLLEKLLNRMSVGLSNKNIAPAFKSKVDPDDLLSDMVAGDEGDSIREMEEKLGFRFHFPLDPFDSAFEGYVAYCGLFGQDPFADINILSNFKNADINRFDTTYLNYSQSSEKDIERLLKSIMRSIVGISVEGYKYPDDPYEYWETLQDQKQEYDSGKEPENARPEDGIDIWSLKEDDLRTKYYEGLLKKTGGNVRLASKLAGLKENTLRSRMDELQIPYKKSNRINRS
jgi:DNA-binding NtrC family response regulator